MRAIRGPRTRAPDARPLSDRALRTLAPSALAEDRLRRWLRSISEAEKRGFWSGVLVVDGHLAPVDLRAGSGPASSLPQVRPIRQLSAAAWRRLLASDAEVGQALERYLRTAPADEVAAFWAGAIAMDGGITVAALANGVRPLPAEPAPASLPGLLCLWCNRPLPARVITAHTGRLRIYHPTCKDRARRRRARSA